MPSPDNAVRLLTAGDIAGAMTLSGLAGWNQTAADWRLLISLYPEGCLAIECGGKVAATTTLICYEDQLAWLGMVLTCPEYRRRGFARRLVESALAIAEAKKIASVKLDATEQGLPLYESLGFRVEQTIEGWSRAGNSNVDILPGLSAGAPDLTLDREAFGANRTSLLEKLAAAGGRTAVGKDGFAISRPGARASYLGPCVARSPENARILIQSCLAGSNHAWFWDLLPSNRGAVRLAEDLGFESARTLVRMVKGQHMRGNETMIYAAGGFELG